MTPDELTSRLAVTQLELEAKGWPADSARAATKRAVRYSRSMSQGFSSGIRDQAFGELLDMQLRGAEAWLEGMAAARERGDYEEGMQRAVRDGRWERGLRRAGVEPGPGVRDAWRGSVGEAVEGWGG